MNNNGFVKIYRSITNCAFWGKPNAVTLFIYLVMAANLTPSTFKGKKLQRGQLLTTLPELSEKTGLTVKQVRVALETLKRADSVADVSSPQNRIITVINFDKYQVRADSRADEGQTEGRQRADEGQTYYIKEEKEYKKNKNLRREEGGVAPAPPPLTEQSLISDYGLDNYNAYVKKVSNWKSNRGISGGADLETVAKWLAEDKAKGRLKTEAKCKAGNDSSFKVEDVEKLAMKKYD